MKLEILILSSVLMGMARAAQADPRDPAQEKKKLQFLSKPVFYNNRAENLGRMRIAPSQPSPPMPAPGPIPRQTDSEPIKVAAAPLRDVPQECGENAYLGKYCFKPSEPPQEWVLCTEKWGGCITERKAEEK